MSAMADNVVSFAIPKQPKVKLKEAPPDQRKIAVLPIRAVFDDRLHHGAIRVLAALCSYCNRAGITWVSQTRLAKELKISQQAVAKQYKQLKQYGYMETMRKGYKGERTDTTRVIFDPTIDAETAMAVTSTIEDTRPPAIKREQQMQADKQAQQQVAKEISKVLKQPAKRAKATPKPTDSVTVKNMKAAINKAHQSGGQHVDNNMNTYNLEVVLNHNLEVVDNTEEDMRGLPVISRHVTSKLLKEKEADMLVLSNLEVNELKSDGMTTKQIADSLNTLLPLYKAEGITPTSKVLMAGIRQLKADAR